MSVCLLAVHMAKGSTQFKKLDMIERATGRKQQRQWPTRGSGVQAATLEFRGKLINDSRNQIYHPFDCVTRLNWLREEVAAAYGSGLQSLRGLLKGRRDNKHGCRERASGADCSWGLVILCVDGARAKGKRKVKANTTTTTTTTTLTRAEFDCMLAGANIAHSTGS